MEKYKGSPGLTVTGGLPDAVTPWAGVGLLVELYRKAGIGVATEQALPCKKSTKGLSQAQMVESFVLLSALGGDRIGDTERLRHDEGLQAVLGYFPPAAETARQWLDKFHDGGC